jgi:hypothetical protein
MKKYIVPCFLILFLLSTSAFAGISDPKKESEKQAINDRKEIKLSDEEISRLSRRAETDNLNNPSLTNSEKTDSKDKLKPPVQSKNHAPFYVGASVLILLIILLLVLV